MSNVLSVFLHLLQCHPEPPALQGYLYPATFEPRGARQTEGCLRPKMTATAPAARAGRSHTRPSLCTSANSPRCYRGYISFVGRLTDEGWRFTRPISIAIRVHACVIGGRIGRLPAELVALLSSSTFSNDGRAASAFGFNYLLLELNTTIVVRLRLLCLFFHLKIKSRVNSAALGCLKQGGQAQTHHGPKFKDRSSLLKNLPTGVAPKHFILIPQVLLQLEDRTS